jgi:hypothetical protein
LFCFRKFLFVFVSFIFFFNDIFKIITKQQSCRTDYPNRFKIKKKGDKIIVTFLLWRKDKTIVVSTQLNFLLLFSTRSNKK